jgi:predicted glycosyltransferase involved in capsule biosynthesis
MEPITICITTFKRRLEIFKSLVDQIKQFYPDIQILVAINGEHEDGMDEDYRKNILQYISTKNNVIPIMFTEFRSLSKLWNNLVIFSKTNYNLVLNDDLVFENPNIILDIQNTIEKTRLGLFVINGIWSHFVVNKEKLHDLGYFDERLLSHGEEDGDMLWRYIEKYDSGVPSLAIPGIYNMAEGTDTPTTNMDSHYLNKPRFNSTFISEKYKESENAIISGWFGKPRIKVIDDQTQYPYEMFWWKNRKNIKKGIKIDFD